MPDIDFISIIMLLGLGAGAFMLVLLMKKMTARKKLRVVDSLFQHVVVRHSLKVSKTDRFYCRLIAIDEQQKHLIFIDNNEKLRGHVIRLADVAECTLTPSGIQGIERIENGRTKKETLLNDLSIVLVMKNRTTIDLPVYLEKLDGPFQNKECIQLAELWHARIVAAINNRSQRSRPLPLTG